MIGDVGMSELLVIFLIVLILFGADRIPTLAKGLGKGIREFKRIVNSANDEIQKAIDIDDATPPKRVRPPVNHEDMYKAPDTTPQDEGRSSADKKDD